MKIDWFALYLNAMVLIHAVVIVWHLILWEDLEAWFSLQCTISIIGLCLYERIKVAQNINLHFDNDTTSKEVTACIKAVITGKETHS